MTLHLDPHRDRPAWEADRRHYLGASDAAAVLGLSPWRTPLDVWLHKTGRVTPQPATIAMRRGHALEHLIAELWAEQVDHDDWPTPGTTLIHPKHPHVASTPDLHVGRGLVECKDVGPYTANDWRDGAPQHVRVQAMVQLAVTGAEWCDIAALIAGRNKLHIERVHASPLDARICEALERWWNDHVTADQPPPLTGPPRRARDDLAALYPAGYGEVPAAPADIASVLELAQLKAQRAELDDEITAAENRLRERIGEATDLVHPDTGAPIATWRMAERAVTDWDAVCADLATDIDHLNIAITAHTERRPYRTLRTYPNRARRDP